VGNTGTGTSLCLGFRVFPLAACSFHIHPPLMAGRKRLPITPCKPLIVGGKGMTTRSARNPHGSRTRGRDFRARHTDAISGKTEALICIRNLRTGCREVGRRKSRRTEESARGNRNYLVLACRARRVASRVLMSDSLGSFWMIGSMAHPSPNGTSRVSDKARHSTTTPSSRFWNCQ
jgi:hypothetical protein